MPLIHPEFEVTTPPGLAAEPDTYRGPEGVRRYFESFYEAMDKVEFEPERFIAVGERVVVPMTLRARGRTTGIETAQEIVQVWELEDGRAIRVSVHATLEEAMRRAAGSPVPPGSSTRRRVRRRDSSPSESAPARRIDQRPVASRAVRSTTVDGSPRSWPPSMARSTPALMAGVDVGEPTRRGPATEIGARLEDRAPGAGEWALDQAQPEPIGILAAGERVAVFGVVHHQGHRARKQGADRLPGSRPEGREQLAHRERREEHHRRRLAVLAPLEGVDAIDGGAVGGIAGQPVERVGGKQRDPPFRDAPLQRLAGSRRAVPLDRDDHQRAHAAQHDARDARQVLAALDLAEAEVEHQLGHRAGLAGAHLEGERSAGGERGNGGRRDRGDHLDSVGSGHHGLPRLVSGDLRREPLPLVIPT